MYQLKIAYFKIPTSYNIKRFSQVHSYLNNIHSFGKSILSFQISMLKQFEFLNDENPKKSKERLKRLVMQIR